jgi:hypothetical protein
MRGEDGHRAAQRVACAAAQHASRAAQLAGAPRQAQARIMQRSRRESNVHITATVQAGAAPTPSPKQTHHDDVARMAPHSCPAQPYPTLPYLCPAEPRDLEAQQWARRPGGAAPVTRMRMADAGAPDSATACRMAATTRAPSPLAAHARMKPRCTSGERPSHQAPRRGGWHTRHACASARPAFKATLHPGTPSPLLAPRGCRRIRPLGQQAMHQRTARGATRAARPRKAAADLAIKTGCS